VSDIGKVGVIAAIMGALLLFGLLLTPVQSEQNPEVVTSEEPVVTEVRMLPPTTLEMLDPIYSEKAVFQDDTIRIAFDVSLSDADVESRLPFWLHNVSDSAIIVLWDRCSIMLPEDNTVNVITESGLASYAPSSVISVAPAGDLFEAVIPVTELDLESESGAVVTTGVLDQGTFAFVLAIEREARRGDTLRALLQRELRARQTATGCEETIQPAVTSELLQRIAVADMYRDREVVYYTFRFVIR